MVRIVSLLFVLVIVIFGMTFAILNPDSVTINYYLGHYTLPLSLLLVLVFAGGCLVGMTAGLWLLVKAKIQSYRLQHRLTLAEEEVANLRAIPLQSQM
jgi:putative membrane protein